jgi:hypothetical protein
MTRSTVIPALPLAVLLCGSALAQQIQRCEDARGRITYSNADCPDGTRPVRSVQSAPTPSAEATQSAREKAERDAQTARQLSDERRSQQSAAALQKEQQRKADCAYLQGEIQSLQRMRNMLVNRPYYSLDDLNTMDQHAMMLMADYRRACGS